MEKKARGEKTVSLTCYDYPTAVIMEEAGIDLILVGDSVGANMLGYETELEVTMDDMIHHLKAVKRGIKDACLVSDMPYASYKDVETALINARKFVDHGADMVKLEGFHENIIASLTADGIEVIAHIGLNPQASAERRAFGKKFDEAVLLIDGATRLEAAGAKMIVLEKIPQKITEIITRELSIPTIGIGSGRFCDLQILVIYDIIGFAPKKFKHIKVYGDIRKALKQAVTAYKEDCTSGGFPADEHANIIPLEEFEKVTYWMQNGVSVLGNTRPISGNNGFAKNMDN
ncbi:MAG: 3-methyl-2-oxobutanoate hydroxymethyltransferase [Deltaproteobacteria bacterium]|nr:3-methyl-2-oxobutanoate hydroxymethyltransferase [Deltaproteobacteria bacterium]